LAKFVDRKFHIADEDPSLVGKSGIPTDVATGAYIQHMLKQKDVEVDFITPKEITKQRLKSNDLNFLLIYDVLEAFHTDKSPGKEVYKNLKKCLLETKNVYPPRDYQEFFYSKIEYYNYLQAKKVNVLPTFTMTAKEYYKIGHDAAIRRVFDWWDQEGLRNVLAKPVYGQEGKDIMWFDPPNKECIGYYFKRNMRKYPGLVVQQMVKDFGNTKASPELRMYFLGGEYKYSVCATNIKSAKGKKIRVKMQHPKVEGGTLDVPLKRLKGVTHKILKKLPKIVMPNGVRLPRLITRLDMGYKIDGKFRPFVNEVEFVPSLYVEHSGPGGISKEIDAYIAQCAKDMVKITRQYVKDSRASRKRLSAAGKQHASRRVKQHVLKLKK
jgi:hypothetical protein